MENKIKVVLICHFSTPEVRTRLSLDKRRLYSIVRRLLRLPTKVVGYGDIAPWDKDLIEYLTKRDDIDLYVISAHTGLKKSVCHFKMEGVNYWFVRCDVATMLKRLVPNCNLWLKLNPMVPNVHRIVKQINPDIINLQGNENAYYSSTVLGLKGYPIFSFCQTIYNNPDRSIYGFVDKTNAYIEKEIFKTVKYFGVYCKMHYELLRQLAPDAHIFKFGYPGNEKLLIPTTTDKEYDFVNFALGMSDKKGFYDAVKALAIVKKRYPNVTLNFVGGADDIELAKIKTCIKENNVELNVIFTPFFEKQCDLFRHIQKARFALLPCKMDNIAGTMNQAMQLMLPLIVYKTPGTPIFNREKECALIAENCNVEDLAAKMMEYLDNPEYAKQNALNAREYQELKVVELQRNGNNIVEGYKAVINNYQNGIGIPGNLLFNSEKDV